jgi:hypothetical protein
MPAGGYPGEALAWARVACVSGFALQAGGGGVQPAMSAGGYPGEALAWARVACASGFAPRMAVGLLRLEHF